MTPIEVTCALILRDGKILVVQRSQGMPLAGMWEFPGGKVEDGETYEECIVREIKEELALDITLSRAISPSDWNYPDKSIRLIPFIATIPHDQEPVLKEHSALCWATTAELHELPLAPADVPILQTFQEISAFVLIP